MTTFPGVASPDGVIAPGQSITLRGRLLCTASLGYLNAGPTPTAPAPSGLTWTGELWQVASVLNGLTANPFVGINADTSSSAEYAFNPTPGATSLADAGNSNAPGGWAVSATLTPAAAVTLTLSTSNTAFVGETPEQPVGFVVPDVKTSGGTVESDSLLCAQVQTNPDGSLAGVGGGYDGIEPPYIPYPALGSFTYVPYYDVALVVTAPLAQPSGDGAGTPPLRAPVNLIGNWLCGYWKRLTLTASVDPTGRRGNQDGAARLNYLATLTYALDTSARPWVGYDPAHAPDPYSQINLVYGDLLENIYTGGTRSETLVARGHFATGYGLSLSASGVLSLTVPPGCDITKTGSPGDGVFFNGPGLVGSSWRYYGGVFVLAQDAAPDGFTGEGRPAGGALPDFTSALPVTLHNTAAAGHPPSLTPSGPVFIYIPTNAVDGNTLFVGVDYSGAYNGGAEVLTPASAYAAAFPTPYSVDLGALVRNNRLLAGVTYTLTPVPQGYDPNSGQYCVYGTYTLPPAGAF